MKYKLFSVAMALVLALSLCLVMAVPAGADAASRQAAIKLAADHIAANQNTDGGFDWVSDTDTSKTSYTNLTGVTALGILKAWELDSKPAYDTALAKAYKYCVDNVPSYVWDGSKYNEETKGVDSANDISFLIDLSGAAASDTDLMTAITSVVSGTTSASQIADLAKLRWDNVVSHLGADQESPANGTATTWAQRIRDDRHSQGWDALIPWGLDAGVEATFALDGAYPGEGYDQQALDIVQVIYDSVGDSSTYFDTDDTGEASYIIGLSGIVSAYAATGTHSSDMATYAARIRNLQQPDGWWYWYGGSKGSDATMSVQETAYAVMALLAEGSVASINAMNKGADWLTSSQNVDGGWYAEQGTGDEYPEVDGEAATAMTLSLGSGILNLTANVPDIVAISVTPTNIDYGTLVPGQNSDVKAIVVSNIGTRAADVDADVSGAALDLFHDYLYLANNGSPDYTVGPHWDNIVSNLLINNSDEIQSQLRVGSSYTPKGTETAQLIFTATAH